MISVKFCKEVKALFGALTERSGAQSWAPERRMSKIKNGGLDQYGVGPFEQQQFGTAGIEGVNSENEYWIWS